MNTYLLTVMTWLSTTILTMIAINTTNDANFIYLMFIPALINDLVRAENK